VCSLGSLGSSRGQLTADESQLGAAQDGVGVEVGHGAGPPGASQCPVGWWLFLFCQHSKQAASNTLALESGGSDRMRTGGPQHAMTYKCRLRAPAAAT
jgi:hypothetical protein